MEKILYKGKELFSPKLDLVFKALFGKEDSKELLRSFLNSVLDLDIQSPNDIILTNTEIVSETADNKLSRLDICAEIKNVGNNEHIDIEIQLTKKDNMMKRSVYYVSKLFSEQLKRGDTYESLGRAIGLSILDFNIFDDNRWLHSARLKDTLTNFEFTDCFEINFVEMKKLSDIQQSNDEKLQWLLFLNAKTEKEIDMLVQQNAQIGIAINKLEKISSDKAIQYELLMREKAERDHISEVAYAKSEGIQQGVLQTAQNLKQIGIPLTQIVQATGLSENEIKKL